MSASRPIPQVLDGRFVRLEPLLDNHLVELHAAIGHPEVYAGGYGGGPGGYRENVDDFVEWARQSYTWATNLPMAVRVVGGNLDGTLVGTSTLGDFDLNRGHAHIGWTAYDPRVWGTQVNAESKLLMLGLAFDSGFERVKIQTDVLNERSRAAVSGIGATFEGIVRHDVRRADGSWRDTAVYSIVREEWRGVRAGLEARLAGWDGPVQFRNRS